MARLISAICRSWSGGRGLESFIESSTTRVSISHRWCYSTPGRHLPAARADPANAGASDDAGAVEGVMLKRRDAAYVPGRPKGLWWKWKRDPLIVDAVLMYAQRGHGKRSSYYSDYTFGVWTKGESGDELVPVGKAYFGFTDEELHQIDRFVRNNTIERFGPVREVTHEAEQGLVFEVAFEGLQRSTRHKSGVAMRFPVSTGCAGTSRRAKRTGWKHWKRCCHGSKADAARRAVAAKTEGRSRRREPRSC